MGLGNMGSLKNGQKRSKAMAERTQLRKQKSPLQGLLGNNRDLLVDWLILE